MITYNGVIDSTFYITNPDYISTNQLKNEKITNLKVTENANNRGLWNLWRSQVSIFSGRVYSSGTHNVRNA